MERLVKICAEKIDPNLIVEVCGSFRRGKMDCGDVDMLITNGKGFSVDTILTPLVYNLQTSGFLTDVNNRFYF